MTHQVAKAAIVGPAARRKPLRAVKAGHVWVDADGVSWRRESKLHKVRIAAAALSVVEGMLRLDGDRYVLTEVGEAELARLEES